MNKMQLILKEQSPLITHLEVVTGPMSRTRIGEIITDDKGILAKLVGSPQMYDLIKRMRNTIHVKQMAGSRLNFEEKTFLKEASEVVKKCETKMEEAA